MRINDLLENLEIGENVNFKAISEILQNHCKDIYKIYGLSNIFLVHNVSYDGPKENYLVLDNKKGRKPSDTPEFFHDYVNQKLDEKFGVKFRSESLFTYPQYADSIIDIATDSRYVVFPFDGYKAIAAPFVHDLYIIVRDTLHGDDAIILIKNFLHQKIDEADHLDEDQKEAFRKDLRSHMDMIARWLMPTLPKKSWIKSEDFPNNIERFKEEFHEATKRLSGVNLEQFNISDKEYKSLLDSILQLALEKLDTLVEKYYGLIKSKSDLEFYTHNDNRERRSEVMVHSHKFLLISTHVFARHKDKDESLNDFIKRLYKGEIE